MEKTVLQQKETYMDSVHRWGRIWGLSLMLLILAYPITVSLIFHAQVNWPAFVKGFIAIGPMYWAVGIVEIFTYVPMLGAGGSCLCSLLRAQVFRPGFLLALRPSFPLAGGAFGHGTAAPGAPGRHAVPRMTGYHRDSLRRFSFSMPAR